MFRKTVLLSVAGAVAAVTGATPATAQSNAATGQLEEVIVTARRAEESLQEVPMSIVALSGEELDRKLIRNLNDLPSVSPGLSVQNTAANRSDAAFSIRGQGQGFGQATPGAGDRRGVQLHPQLSPMSHQFSPRWKRHSRGNRRWASARSPIAAQDIQMCSHAAFSIPLRWTLANVSF